MGTVLRLDLNSGPDQQQSRSIPRRLVARVCLDALETPASVGRVLEITSRPEGSSTETSSPVASSAAPDSGLAAWLA